MLYRGPGQGRKGQCESSEEGRSQPTLELRSQDFYLGMDPAWTVGKEFLCDTGVQLDGTHL